MARSRTPADIVVDIRREVERSIMRGRNGIRMVSGASRARVGQTPRETIWTHDRIEVWHYTNRRVTQAEPLLLVMSLVTRTYIFDLLPGNSIVEKLLHAGFDVFLIDWGVPDHTDSKNTLETYVDGYLPLAVDVVRQASGTGQVSVLGYCLGGLIALLCLAGNLRVPISKLALIATPVNFDAMGLPVSLIRAGRLDAATLVDHTGNVPPGAILNAFRARNPTGEIVQYANLLENLWNDDYVRGYQALNQWIHDHIPFPGAAARQAIELLVRKNQLMKGHLQLGGRRVRLRAVKCPVLNVVAEKDDVVPLDAAAPVVNLVGSKDVETLSVPAGHVALVTGRWADRVTIPGIIDWLRRHSESSP